MLTRDDSGYFGNHEDDDQDLDMIDDTLKLIRTPDLLDSPTQRALRRTDSISSIRSHRSRGSSQLWDGNSTPDEDMLLAVEDTESQLLRGLQQSETRDDHGTLEDTYEVVAPERRLSQSDRPHTFQSGRKNPRLERDGFDDPALVETNNNHVPTSSRDSMSFLQRLFNSSSSLEAGSLNVIAHSEHHQRFFDKHKLPWGVQWEIARLVSCGRIAYDDIPLGRLSELALSNTLGGPMVETLLCPQEGNTQRRQLYNEAFAKEISARTPWSELDKEEECLTRDPLSGLGSTSPQDDWYGGKVSFVAKLRQKEVPKSAWKPQPQYFLELEPPELGASTRVMRRWGSRRFLRVRIPDTLMYHHDNQLLEYFSQLFVIHGKVFQPFYAKDSGVFLLEINQTYSQRCLMADPSPTKISLDEFLEWHNPMQTNKKQSLAKWCARMALGLSNSVPGTEFAGNDITEIDDKHSAAGQAAIAAGHKPESKDVMTDGCGFTNQATLVDAKYRYKWDLVPSAMQFRSGGCKGLILRHPDDNGFLDAAPRIWVRPSQKKISYSPDAPRDRAHSVLDILRRSHLKYPARLSAEIIVNLAENGVSYDVFEGLMTDGLEAIAASLTQWSGPYAMQNLWAAVARQGSVIRARMSREAAGSSRALGFGSRDREDDEEIEDEEAIDIPAGSKAWWADEISGCPSTLEETVLVLLDAGFEPQSCHILAFKLKEVFKKAMNSYIEKYKIEVPRSAEAWIVPDPCGVLEPGEIFLRTTEQIIDRDGLKTDHLLGDVLVTRHPCRVPTDVQKVRAVWKDELRGYYDVIIFSVQGERSLASKLGGGDYDGDTAHAIWDPAVVAAFMNADDKFADPPPGLDDAFEKNTLTVEEFLEKDQSYEAMAAERQSYLLAALKDRSLVGSYSNWHDTAVYKFGYHSDEAWRLAYMFCAVLDSSKTGKTVKPDILSRDRRAYQGPGPEWKASILDENNNSPPPDQGAAPRRQGPLTSVSFIMDMLKASARKQYHHHMACFEKLLEESRGKFKTQRSVRAAWNLYVDPALEAPWINAVERADKLAKIDRLGLRMKEELEAIRRHVEDVCERHQELVRQDTIGKERRRRQPMSPRREGATFTDKPIEQRQNILREISLSFSYMDFDFIVLDAEQVRRYKASYAYILETGRHEKRNSGFSRFPFDVAMRELGIIKAASVGPCSMISSRFYSVFSVVGVIKAFRPTDGLAYTC